MIVPVTVTSPSICKGLIQLFFIHNDKISAKGKEDDSKVARRIHTRKGHGG